MSRLGGYQSGKTFLIEREKLGSALAAIAAGEAFHFEAGRRERLGKALAELGDPRAAQRLRQVLRDGAGEVRDAAFTALARLEEKAPLRAAEAGLHAAAEDVRAPP